MKIKSLKINGFGKIKDKEIDLVDGINIVYGENESGKSTILKFIIGMLYGSSKNKRGKDISDFEKFIPWNIENFSGKMKYDLDSGEEFEIYREFKKKNPKIFNEKLEDISKSFKQDKAKGIEFIEEQVGIDEDTFINTAIIEQTESKLSQSSQSSIVQKLSNQLSTGDDSISFKKIIDKINKSQNEKVGTSKTSQRPINIVEEKIKILEKRRSELEKIEDEIKNSEKQDNQIIYDIKNEEIKIELLKKCKSKLEENRLKNAELNFNKNLENEYNEKIEELNKKILEDKKQVSINKKMKKVYIVDIVLILVSIVLFILKKNIVALGILGLAIILTFVCFLLIKQKEKNTQNIIKNKEKEIEILNNNKDKKIEEIEQKNSKIEEDLLKDKKKLIDEYNDRLDFNFLENAISMNYDEILVSIENKEKLLNDLKIKEKLNKIELEKNAEKIEEKMKIEEQLENAYIEKEDLEILNNNYNIAKECLNEAYLKMKNSISPKFQEDLSYTIKEISDGKYNKIKFDDENGLTVENENGDYIPAERLSIGTIDQMYLSLRLSALKQISKENIPIILDEAFAYYDDERLKNILLYLENLENQIIIFTCTKRESQILENLNINYNIIKL